MTPAPDNLRPDGRLSPLLMERYLAGELDEEARQRVEDHLASHPEEQGRIEAAQGHTASFGEDGLPIWLVAAQQPPAVAEPPRLPRPANRVFMGAVAVAATALVALSMGLPVAPTPTDHSVFSEVRTKGGPMSVALVRSTPEGPELLTPGMEVQAGDTLGVTVQAQRPGYITVIGADRTGTTYSVLASQQVDADSTAQGAIELDATPGQEWIAAVYCADVIDAPWLSRSLSSAARSGDADSFTVPKGCTPRLRVLDKAPATP
jgi:anti-sigma factor RsiW